MYLFPDSDTLQEPRNSAPRLHASQLEFSLYNLTSWDYLFCFDHAAFFFCSNLRLFYCGQSVSRGRVASRRLDLPHGRCSSHYIVDYIQWLEVTRSRGHPNKTFPSQ